MWYMHDFGGGWMIFGGIAMILFWAGLIALSVWGISKFTGRRGFPDKQSPQDIVRERYARGEISREEYEQMKRDL